MKKYQSCLSENFQFLEVKFSIYLNRRVFVMDPNNNKSSAEQGNIFPWDVFTGK